MLRYEVKPNRDTELRGFPIRELYVSPDLSYVSGVTDENVGLVNGEEIIIKSPYLIGSESNTINTKHVKRQGKVKVSLTLPVKTITMPLNFPIYTENDGTSYILAFNKKIELDEGVEGDYIISSVTQNYVEYKGDICYFFDGNNSGYLIDHKFYESLRSDTAVTITTYFYIEDGKLQIGDYTYYADFSNPASEPQLRLNKNHAPIGTGDMIGLIDGCECVFNSIKDYEQNKWKKIIKFYILKANNPVVNIDTVIYGGYKHYVNFNDVNYYLRDVYQKNDNGEDDTYLGYGILLEGDFYKPSINYGDALYETYNDLPYEGSYLYLGKYDESLEIRDTLISPSDGGRFVLLIGSDDGNDIVVGNFIIAESNSPIEMSIAVEEDDENIKYIAFEGKKYLVEPKIYDTIKISGEEFLLTYLNDEYSSASTIINGETIFFDVTGSTARISSKIYYKGSDSTEDLIKVKYGKNENLYEISENSGVTINNNRYRVITDYGNSDEDIEFNYVKISENIKITLEVTDINGSSTYISYPVVDDDTIGEVYKNELQREYSNIIVNNFKSFNFTLRKDTFGKKPLTVENGLMDSMKSFVPYSISDAYTLENKIDILRVQNYLSFKIPLPNKTANNLRREEIIKNDFVDYIREESTNSIVDMEKDVYSPAWLSKNEFKPIQQIRFNLHFRTRNLENWKIYEDDREFKNVETPNSKKSNWFVTDYDYYSNILNNGTDTGKLKLHNSSDLLGLLNFTTDEIKSQSSKIKKSFLRLSFYSTNNPNTHVLLGTSTIFLDESLAFKKYLNSKRNADLVFIDVDAMQKNDNIRLSSSNTISNTSEVAGDLYLNDNIRLSSRFTVNNKYNTQDSSEGFYLYMFKDYSTKMRESTIYMKVDFNHAGIGKTMSFMLPRIIQYDDVDGIGQPIFLNDENNLQKLKDGFKLNDIYKQTYIPIKLKFDSASNKYVYFLPNELRENETLGVDDEIMEFNLFETKFANESIVENVS